MNWQITLISNIQKMKKVKPQSSINLLTGRAVYTDEPLWFRLVITLISAIFILIVIFLLKALALPGILTIKAFGINWLGIFQKKGELPP